MLRDDRIISKLLSLRAGTEGFLKTEIDRVRSKSDLDFVKVLDVACGWGVSFASGEKTRFYGVDIAGFPKDITISNGYVEAREYEENLQIPYPDDSFDVCTMINLNAHVPTSLYADLLTQIKRKLKPDAELLIVAELDNIGLSYRVMRYLSRDRLQRMVKGMDHTNFVFEQNFDEFLAENGVEVMGKETIVGNMLPLMHYTSWAFGISPYETLRYPAFIIDAAMSIIDNLMTRMGLAGRERRFIVGYRCKFSRDHR